MSIRLVDDAYAAPYPTAWGEGWVYVRDGRLVGVELPGEGQIDQSSKTGGAPARPVAPGACDAAALAFWARELEAYFAGERTTFTAAEVPLSDMRLGVFERRVYEALLSVPAGQTVSYGELAEMAGYPRAARAVGNAMAANPIPVVVPCHRVIRSDGTMGRYGNDPTWKQRLLVHEGWAADATGATRDDGGLVEPSSSAVSGARGGD
jgi:methylated-DNA-[protein]-cysteine S-methyltransferase